MRLQFAGGYQPPLKQTPVVQFGNAGNDESDIISVDKNHTGTIGGPAEKKAIIVKAGVTLNGSVETTGAVVICKGATIIGDVKAGQQLTLDGCTVKGNVTGQLFNCNNSTIDGDLNLLPITDIQKMPISLGTGMQSMCDMTVNNIFVDLAGSLVKTLILEGEGMAVKGQVIFKNGEGAVINLTKGAQLRDDQVNNGTIERS